MLIIITADRVIKTDLVYLKTANCILPSKIGYNVDLELVRPVCQQCSVASSDAISKLIVLLVVHSRCTNCSRNSLTQILSRDSNS